MKTIIICLVIATLTGCAAKELGSVVEQVDTRGNVLSKTYNINSKEYAKMERVKYAEQARTECYKSSTLDGLDSHAQVAAIVAQASGKGANCGAGYNDVLVAQENRKLGQTKARTGLLGTVAKAVVGGYIGGKAIDVLSDISSSQGTNINAETGSNVDLNGAFGENNSATSSQGVGEVAGENIDFSENTETPSEL